MRCAICPLYSYRNNESDKEEACAMFGGWDSRFQYEDKVGTIVGCYIDKHYIEKVECESDKYCESMVNALIRKENE